MQEKPRKKSEKRGVVGGGGGDKTSKEKRFACKRAKGLMKSRKLDKESRGVA